MVHHLAILVLEDDLAIQDFVVEALCDEGYYAHAVTTVAGARTAMTNQGWDLLLTDLWLPDITGLVFARELRQSGMKLPIVLMTADPNVHFLDLSDVSFCLTKPFELGVLFDCIYSHIRPQMQ